MLNSYECMILQEYKHLQFHHISLWVHCFNLGRQVLLLLDFSTFAPYLMYVDNIDSIDKWRQKPCKVGCASIMFTMAFPSSDFQHTPSSSWPLVEWLKSEVALGIFFFTMHLNQFRFRSSCTYMKKKKTKMLTCFVVQPDCPFPILFFRNTNAKTWSRFV